MLNWDEIAAKMAAVRASGKRIVFTNGVFDILHRGHVTYLADAKKLGDVLFVGINSDASVKRLKGPERPLVPEGDREYMISQLKSVDFTAIFEQDTPAELIQLVRPHFLVKGGDYQKTEIVGWEFVESIGGQVIRIPLVEGLSTTNLVDKIRNR